MKFIREGRFGPPKTYKTGAVVSSYPKPMLVLEGDDGGLDVIDQRILGQPIKWLADKAAVEAESKLAQPALAPVSAYNFVRSDPNNLLNELYKVTPDRSSFSLFVDVANILGRNCPWKTVVLDPITNLSQIIYSHLSSTDSSQMADPRKWAFSIGLKVQQVIAAFTKLQTHVVFIMHSQLDKNELTSVIVEEPMLYSKHRDKVGADLSQFFYSAIEGGKPVVWTSPQGYVKGIGARWPANLPAKCPAFFNDIYGSAVKAGEIAV